jgi:hypothetical protein
VYGITSTPLDISFAVRAVRSGLVDPSPMVRRAVIESLTWKKFYRDANLWQDYLRLMTADPDPQVREFAVRHVQDSISMDVKFRHDPLLVQALKDLIEHLLRTSATDAESRVRAQAGLTLGQIMRSLGYLPKLSERDNAEPVVDLASIESALLEQSVNDADPRVRSVILRALDPKTKTQALTMKRFDAPVPAPEPPRGQNPNDF